MTSFSVCLFRIILEMATNDVRTNQIMPKIGFKEKNNAVTKTLKAVCIELLMKKLLMCIISMRINKKTMMKSKSVLCFVKYKTPV